MTWEAYLVVREYDSQLLDGTEKLILSDSAFILDIEEFECLIQESSFIWSWGTLHLQLLPERILETKKRWRG